MFQDSYFFCPENRFMYRLRLNELGNACLECSTENKGWYDWPISSIENKGMNVTYHLSTFDKQTKALFIVPDHHSVSPVLVFKQTLPHQQNSEMQFKLIKMDKDPVLCPEPSSVELTDQQKKALLDHKAKLEKRCFEYRVLSYFFKTGYSRGEKIREINHLLNGEAYDSKIIHQGRTGQIVAKPSPSPKGM